MEQPLISYTLLVACPLPLLAEGHGEERIAHAQSAAPAFISENAIIVVNGAIVKEGTNGWTCRPETMPGGNVLRLEVPRLAEAV